MKTTKATITLIALAGAFCLTTSAFAQDIGAKIESVQKNLATVKANYLDAQINIGKALGIKEDSLKALENAMALASSSKDKDTKTVKTATDAATKAIQESMQKGTALSDAAKEQFKAGAEKFGTGLVTQVAQIPTVKSIVTEGQAAIKSGNPVQKAKLTKALAPATSLASSLPGDVKAAGETAKMILDFSNKNNIKVPSLEGAVSGLDSL